MSWDDVFQVASTAVLPCWLALVLLPRHPLLLGAVRTIVVGGLALFYAVLILVHFFRAEGGGFGSIAEVRALFASDPVLVAGWIHYLAFDLLVGLGIAEAADRAGLSRLIQGPILAATFLFGPLGLLLFRLTTLIAGRQAHEGALA